MDLLNWVAASKRLKFACRSDENSIRAELRRHHERGFIMDFADAPVITKEEERKILLFRASSFWGAVGPRCVAYLLPAEQGTRLEARIWHGPFFTSWFCLSYSVGILVLAVSILAVFRSSGVAEGFATAAAGGLMASFWIVATGVSNALLRVQRKSSINALIAVLTSLAKEAPNSKRSAVQ